MSRTFLAAALDETGQVRDEMIKIAPGAVLVRISKPRKRGESGPHHAVADFTEQALEIAAAIVDANEENVTRTSDTKGPPTP